MSCQDKGSLLGIYPYDPAEGIYLLEMQIQERPGFVDLSLFFQKDDALPKSDWQTPYDEQYLTSDGKTILGDFFNRNAIPGDMTRIAFFMFLADLSIPLSTPYGQFALTNVQPLPERLKRGISYHPID